MRAVAGRAADAAPLARPRARGAGAAGRRAARCWPAGPSSRARSAWPRARAPGSATTSATCATRRRCAPSREGVAHFERLFAVAPEVVAHDLHPDYLSTTYALAREGVEHVGVQHHHAHLAAVLAEHGERGPAVGAIYDGTGYGTDGTVWGGELLAGDLDGFERAGHLWPVRLPGGDRGGAPAVADGLRLAGRGRRARAACAAARDRAARRWHAVAELARTGLAAPLTTSMGRLFDAVAALCGAAHRGHLRGPGGGRARGDQRPRRARRLSARRRRGVLDARATVAAVALDVAAGVDASRGRGALPSRRRRARPPRRAPRPPARAAWTPSCSPAACGRTACCSSSRCRCSRTRGLRVLVPERLPPNDGAITFGQAAVAAALSSPPPR